MTFDKLRPPPTATHPKRTESAKATRIAELVDTSHLARIPVTQVESAVSTATIAGLSKAAFLHQLRRAVVLASEEELAGSNWTAEGCPWIDYWLSYYGTRSVEQIEAAMRRFASATDATTPEEFIAPAIVRVRVAIRSWRRTGTIGAPFDRVDATTIPPDAIRAELGESRPLDSHVQTRMEQGFGQPLPPVNVHTGPAAATFAREQDARAVAIGSSIGFADAQYRPGTLKGDLLIAHELAHVVQQSGSTRSASHSDPRSDEAHADGAAATALARLAGRAERPAAFPRSRGLSLRRCRNDPFDDAHALDDVRMGETKQQAWLRQFRRDYPQYENIDWAPNHPRDRGLDTESGVRVPEKPEDFLTPRRAYEHRDAAFLAYQGDIHFAELFEARHPTVQTLTNTAGLHTIRDKDLNLRNYVKWSARAKASADGVQVGLMWADIVQAGGSLAARSRATSSAEAGEARVANTERESTSVDEAEAPAQPKEKAPPATMHEGKEVVAEADGADIAGEKHDVIATKEPSGPPRVRMCSKSCDFIVNTLKEAESRLPKTPASQAARQRIAALITEGETIDRELAQGANRVGRGEWTHRLEGYKNQLSDAAKEFPKQIGEPLKDILNGQPLLQPGDAGYTSGVKPNSWTLVGDGEGAHMIEKANVKGRPKLAKFDEPGTPRYYPSTKPENAGQAHLRLHDATARAGVKLGSSPLTDDQLIDAYKKAYSDPSLSQIKGDLRIPGGATIKSNVTPGEAFAALLDWAHL